MKDIIELKGLTKYYGSLLRARRDPNQARMPQIGGSPTSEVAGRVGRRDSESKGGKSPKR